MYIVVCMHIYIYIFLYTYIHVNREVILGCAYIYICVCVYIYIYIMHTPIQANTINIAVVGPQNPIIWVLGPVGLLFVCEPLLHRPRSEEGSTARSKERHTRHCLRVRI